MTHFKKYWWVYLIIAVALYIIIYKSSTKILRAGGAIGGGGTTGGGGHTGGVIGGGGIGSITAFQTYPFGNATNSNINIGLFDENGNPVGGSNLKKKSCADMCGGSGAYLEPYPKNSPYYPYYQCKCGAPW